MMKVGDQVWFRGKFADHFSVRGVIEDIREPAEQKANESVQYGVRLENNNYKLATEGQLRV